MTSITEKSAAIALAEELATVARRMVELSVSAQERQRVCELLADAAESIGATATNIIAAVYEETPAGGTLGAPDGWLPLAGQLIQELDAAFHGGIRQRDALLEAAKIVEEMSSMPAREVEEPRGGLETAVDGRQALIDSGDLPGPDGAYLATTQRAALAQLRQQLATRHGIGGQA